MKKTLLTLFILFISITLTYGLAHAISGVCSNCHTMHNSQGGAEVAKDFSGTPTASVNEHLTISTCLGCHNGQVTGAPIIFGTSTRTAGGTFADSVFSTDQKGHNVSDLDAAGVLTVGLEDTISATPGAEAGGFTEPTPTTLTCAGALGCHGDHSVSGDSMAGIKGFHHQPTGKGYRFLQFYDGSTATPIQGKGSADWEAGGATATNHNVYYALDDDTSASRDSISSLCSLCHGGFHGNSDTASGGAWVRHPTEVDIPSSWDPGVTVDYNNNPFAFKASDYATVTTGVAYSMSDNPKVACISCHRAHGTDNDDILRFDYSTEIAGGGGATNGCLGCHTAQR